MREHTLFNTFQQNAHILGEQLSLYFTRFYEQFKENKQRTHFCFL